MFVRAVKRQSLYGDRGKVLSSRDSVPPGTREPPPGFRSLPAHSHPYEQTGYMIEGKLNLKIAGEEFQVNPGDSCSIPSNAEHSAEVLEKPWHLHL